MKIIATLVIFISVLALAGLAFIYSGLFNVAATEPHTKLERWVFKTTMENSVRKRAPDTIPPSLEDPSLVEKGFRHYRRNCVICHSAPGVDRSAIGQGLTPQPPRLASAQYHQQHSWEPAEFFWIIKHGIKMTGMPAWGDRYPDEDLWALVAFIQRLPELSPAEYHQMGVAEEAHAPPEQVEGDEPVVTVTMTNQLDFVPGQVEITVGQTVLWENTSDIPHTVTAVPDKAQDSAHVQLPEGAEPFNSGNMQAGDTFRHTFEVPGEYRYFCIPHEMGGMIGTVIVKPRQ